MRTPVLLRGRPAYVEWEFLSVTDGPQSILRNTCSDQVITRRQRASFAQCEVLLRVPCVIGVTFDRDSPGRILFQNRCIAVEDSSCLRADACTIWIKKHGL